MQYPAVNPFPGLSGHRLANLRARAWRGTASSSVWPSPVFACVPVRAEGFVRVSITAFAREVPELCTRRIPEPAPVQPGVRDRHPRTTPHLHAVCVAQANATALNES